MAGTVQTRGEEEYREICTVLDISGTKDIEPMRRVIQTPEWGGFTLDQKKDFIKRWTKAREKAENNLVLSNKTKVADYVTAKHPGAKFPKETSVPTYMLSYMYGSSEFDRTQMDILWKAIYARRKNGRDGKPDVAWKDKCSPSPLPAPAAPPPAPAVEVEDDDEDEAEAAESEAGEPEAAAAVEVEDDDEDEAEDAESEAGEPEAAAAAAAGEPEAAAAVEVEDDDEDEAEGAGSEAAAAAAAGEPEAAAAAGEPEAAAAAAAAAGEPEAAAEAAAGESEAAAAAAAEVSKDTTKPASKVAEGSKDATEVAEEAKKGGEEGEGGDVPGDGAAPAEPLEDDADTIDGLKSALADKDFQISDLGQKMQDLVTGIKTIDAKKTVLQQTYELRVQMWKDKCSEAEEQRDAAGERATAAERKTNAAKNEALRLNLHINDLEKSLAAAEKRAQEAEKKATAVKKSLAAAEKRAQEAEKKATAVEEKAATAAEKAATAEGEIDTILEAAERDAVLTPAASNAEGTAAADPGEAQPAASTAEVADAPSKRQRKSAEKRQRKSAAKAAKKAAEEVQKPAEEVQKPAEEVQKPTEKAQQPVPASPPAASTPASLKAVTWEDLSNIFRVHIDNNDVALMLIILDVIQNKSDFNELPWDQMAVKIFRELSVEHLKSKRKNQSLVSVFDGLVLHSSDVNKEAIEVIPGQYRQ